MILLSGSNGLLGTVLKKYFDKKKIIYSTLGRKNCNFNGDIQNNINYPISRNQFINSLS